MTDQHRATPEHRATCLLELRARVEALEAAAISAPENPDTSSDRPDPARSLVKRVSAAVNRTHIGEIDGIARATIREVAAWMQERTGTIANGSQWADMLRDEADK
jgi:hypothetical protein